MTTQLAVKMNPNIEISLWKSIYQVFICLKNSLWRELCTVKIPDGKHSAWWKICTAKNPYSGRPYGAKCYSKIPSAPLFDDVFIFVVMLSMLKVHLGESAVTKIKWFIALIRGRDGTLHLSFMMLTFYSLSHCSK